MSSASLFDVVKSPNDFVWVPGVTPLSSYMESAAITTAYLFVIYSIKLFMRRREAFDLSGIAAVHNFALSAFSLLVFAGCVYSLAAFLRAGGSFDSLFCEGFDPSSTSSLGSARKSQNSGALFFWCYIFYLSKYYDFVDTLLLVLRKKPLGFLHMYHHASLPLLCVLTMSNWRLPVWTGAIINSGVHVIMYYYFGLRMAYPDRKIWWRKYVTVIQILQFTLGFVFIAYFLKIFVLAVNISEEGAVYTVSILRGCAVNPFVVGLNSLVNLSFFILFVDIYIRDNFVSKTSKNAIMAPSNSLRAPSYSDESKKSM